jgi:hypothetical protein
VTLARLSVRTRSPTLGGPDNHEFGTRFDAGLTTLGSYEKRADAQCGVPAQFRGLSCRVREEGTVSYLLELAPSAAENASAVP